MKCIKSSFVEHGIKKCPVCNQLILEYDENKKMSIAEKQQAQKQEQNFVKTYLEKKGLELNDRNIQTATKAYFLSKRRSSSSR